MNKQDNPPDDDESLWQHVLQSVKPLIKKREQHIQQKEKIPIRKNTPIKEQPVVLKEDGRLNNNGEEGAPEKTTTPLPNRDIDRRSLEKLRKGKMPIEDRIDLHGMREAEAHHAFNRFINRAKSSEKRCVLVITGKGKSPQSEGKLRRALPLWIETTFTHDVLAFCPAAAKDGGSGAWYILLRRIRKS